MKSLRWSLALAIVLGLALVQIGWTVWGSTRVEADLGMAGAQTVWQLESPAVWLAAEGELAVALGADGSLTRLAPDGLSRSFGGEWQGPFVSVCGERVLGVDGRGRLAWAGEVGAGPAVEPLSKPACLADGGVVVLGPGGRKLIRLSPELTELAELTTLALPDAQLAALRLAEGSAVVAILEAPTTRYRHGVLGDALEAAEVALYDSGTLAELARYRLPAPYVFEQLRVIPSLVDGRPVFLATRSSERAGAGVVALEYRRGELELVAEGPNIGRSNRWLNLFAAGSQGAYAVRTPHIGGPLERYGLPSLEVEAFDLGVTNHLIGSRNLDLGILSAGETESLVLPSQNLKALRRVRCEPSGCALEDELSLDAALSSNLVRFAEGVLAADEQGRVYYWRVP